jgi:hypothetical protein
MVQKAAEIGYRALRATGVTTPQVYGDICHAFDRHPSRLDEFPESQKIFIPFRLGIVESYLGIKQLLEKRISIMGPQGLCALSFLLNTEKTLTMLQAEYGKQLILREGPGYVEGFKLLHPRMIQMLKKTMPFPDQINLLLDSLQHNPKGEKGELSYPCVTAFHGPEPIVRLVKTTGGKILDKGSLKKPHETITDDGNSIETYPVWITTTK